METEQAVVIEYGSKWKTEDNMLCVLSLYCRPLENSQIDTQ